MENETVTESDSYTCPSFNCYSSDQLSEIAVRVAAENGGANNNEGDQEFEFTLLHDGKEIPTDELRISDPIYPVFNQDLTFNDGYETTTSQENVVVSFGKLIIEDRLEQGHDYNPPSCSTSEADELEDIPAETYCVWRPRAAETSTPSCRKSKSTGSASKRWKFRDLMRRSNSDGNDSFVFLTRKGDKEETDKRTDKERKWSPSAHEALYVQNRAVKEGNRRKSYLPYRRDLVGFFTNVNVLGTHF